MVYRLLSFILLVSSFVYPESILASDSLSYSGRLVKADGSPVSGEVNLKFDLAYTTPSGVGAVLCSQSLPSVSLAHGVFHVKLEPDCSPASLNAVLAQTPAGESVAIRVTDETSGKSYSYQVLHSIPFAQVSKQLTQMGAGLNDILQWDGTQWSPSPVGGGGGVGTVKEIQTGTGLSGGPITATGTISIANGGVNTSQLADGAVTDNKLSSNISRLKLATGTPNYVLMNNGAGVMSEVPQVPLAQGGTGAANAADARTNLGLGLAALLNTGMGATNVLIGGDVRSCEAFEKLQWNLAPVMGWSCVIDKDSLDTTKLPLDGSVAMTGELNMGAKQIKNLAEPLIGTDAATMNYVDTKVGAIETTQWITAGSDIYFDLGRVGIGTSTPETILNIDTAGSGFDKHYIRNRTSSTGLTWEDMAGLSFIKNHSDDSSVNSATVTNEAYGEVAFGGVNSGGENFHSANIIATQVGAASASGPNGAKLRFGTALGDGTSLTTRMIIDNTGYVGIGVLTPSEKLEVSGNIATSGSLKLKSGAVNYVEVKAPLSLGGPLNFILPGTAGSSGQALITDGAGNLSWSSVATTATSLNGDLSGPISNAQINSGAVGSTEIADLSITNSDIANGTITFSKLNFAANDLSIPLVNGLQPALDGKEPTITASDTTKWWRGDKTWQALTTSDVAEGSREYFTQAKVRSTPLTGYAIGANTALLPGDSLLGALGKLQGQISGNGQWLKNDPNIYYNGGNVGIGTNTPEAGLHVVGDVVLSRDVNDSFMFHFLSKKGRGGAIVQNNDELALYDSYGFDGASYTKATSIKSSVDGVPGANDMPGRLEFMTTPDGSSSPISRMTIKNNGSIGIGIDNPSRKLDVSGEVAVRNGYGDVLYLGGDASGNDFEIGSHTTGKNTVSFYNRADATGMRIISKEAYIAERLAVGKAPGSYPFEVYKNFTGISNEVAAFIGGTDVTTQKTGVYFVQKDNIGLTNDGSKIMEVVVLDDPKLTVTGTGKVGIGVAAPTEPLHVNGNVRLGVINPLNTGTFPSYGSFLYFSGGSAGPTHTGDNSDPLFMARYNLASDQTELRINVGDNNQAQDSLNVGYSNAGVWYPRFTARMDGIGIFNNGAQTCTINPASGVVCSSDLRLKDNINPIENALDKVLAVNGVTFTWISDESKEKKREMGFIAQNIEAVAPELVIPNEQGYKQVNYANFVAVLTEGLKEFYNKWLNDSEEKGRAIASVQVQNDELKERVERLENENRELKKAVCEINPNAEICK